MSYLPYQTCKYSLYFVRVPPGRLENICAEHLNFRDLRDLNNLNPGQFQRLRLFVKGLKVELDLDGHRGKRPMPIKDLVRDVGAQVFDKGGVPTTVAVSNFPVCIISYHLTLESRIISNKHTTSLSLQGLWV